MKLFTLILSLFVCSTSFAFDDVVPHFAFNGKSSHHPMIKAGVPTTIEVYFTKKDSDEIIKEFKIMHGKIMHMVIMKDDLSVFKHVHPYFDPVTGRFQLTVNMPLSDPDNFHTANAITEGGMYMVMADVEPKGIGMRMGHTMLHVMGPHSTTPLRLDPIDPETKVVTKLHIEHGKTYKLDMSYTTEMGCNGTLVEFKTTLYVQDPETKEFKVVKDLEEWLSMGAHAVWASENFMNHHGGMHFAHMHSDLAPEEEDDKSLYFNFYDAKIMKDGMQKAWFQIKHEGKVLTIPVIFEYSLEGLIPQC